MMKKNVKVIITERQKKFLLKEGEKIKRNSITEGYDDISMETIKSFPRLNTYDKYPQKKFKEFTLVYVENDKHIQELYKLFGKIIAFSNEDGSEVGSSSFGYNFEGDTELEATIGVRKDYRRKGIATAIYIWIEDIMGVSLAPAKSHSDLAEKFWTQKDRKFGK